MKYDYLCSKCKSVKEDIAHGMLENPEIKCSECGKVMKRAILKTQFILRGQGWGSKNNATADPVRRVREHRVGIKPGFNPPPEQVEKDFGKISKVIDTRPKWSRDIDEKNK